MTERAALTAEEKVENAYRFLAVLLKPEHAWLLKAVRVERDALLKENARWRECYERADAEADDLNRAGLLHRERDALRAALRQAHAALHTVVDDAWPEDWPECVRALDRLDALLAAHGG